MAHAQVFINWFYQVGKRKVGNSPRSDTASHVPDRF